MITLRADFTDRPLEYVDFGDLLRQRTEFVLPLTPDELELAIIQPARQAGLALEAGLCERIIRDLGNQPGTLPLLQYTLTEPIRAPCWATVDPGCLPGKRRRAGRARQARRGNLLRT